MLFIFAFKSFFWPFSCLPFYKNIFLTDAHVWCIRKIARPVATHYKKTKHETIWSELRRQERSLIDQWFRNTLYIFNKELFIFFTFSSITSWFINLKGQYSVIKLHKIISTFTGCSPKVTCYNARAHTYTRMSFNKHQVCV